MVNLIILFLISFKAFANTTKPAITYTLPDEKIIIELEEKNKVKEVCEEANHPSKFNGTFIAIRTIRTPLTKIEQAYDIVGYIENNALNTYPSVSINPFKFDKIYAVNSSKASSLKIGLGRDELDLMAEGRCHKVLVPDDKSIFIKSMFISNSPNIKMNMEMDEHLKNTFLELHKKGCYEKYCVKKSRDDNCFNCIKPEILLATSDLDKNGFIEYWYSFKSILGESISAIEIDPQFQKKQNSRYMFKPVALNLFPIDYSDFHGTKVFNDMKQSKKEVELCKKLSTSSKHLGDIPETIIGIRTNLGRKGSYDIMGVIKNNEFNLDYAGYNSPLLSSYDFGNIFIPSSKKAIPLHLDLGKNWVPGQGCNVTLVPSDKNIFQESRFITNKPDIEFNMIIDTNLKNKFFELHEKGCRNQYCIIDHYNRSKNPCWTACVKPEELLATSDLDKDNLIEYWYTANGYSGQEVIAVEIDPAFKEKDKAIPHLFEVVARQTPPRGC